MIEVRDLSKRFGDTLAVDRVSFRVGTGETLALIGSSGSGKTTTLRMINRLIEPTEGEVLVNDEAVFKRPPEELRRQMGYVIQSTGLFPHYNVLENIGVVPRLLGWEAGRITGRAIGLLRQLGLDPEEVQAKYPSQLSGGQQQRVGIARALAADPPIVLMDEPFGALDPITRTEIRRDFMNLDALRSKTVILVTHDVEEAFEMADRICLLDQGRVQQCGRPPDLLFAPANDHVREFLKGQRLHLEMQTVTLADLAGLLPRSTATDRREGLELPAALSLSQAMRRLQGPGRRGWLVEGGDAYSCTLPALGQAFFRYLAER